MENKVTIPQISDLERLDCILVVGGGKDDWSGDLHIIEDAERGSIRQVDIHKHEVELGFGAEKLYTINHRIEGIDSSLFCSKKLKSVFISPL